MREILFRGKTTLKETREFNNIWVEGDLITSGGKLYIHPQGNRVQVNSELGKIIVMHEIIPETLGQFTGLTDKNGKQVFEGDIIKLDDVVMVVEWYEEYAGFVFTTDVLMEDVDKPIEVIGNIYDDVKIIKGNE